MRLTVILNENERQALTRLSAKEERPPNWQAARLIREGLRQAQVLNETNSPPRGPEAA